VPIRARIGPIGLSHQWAITAGCKFSYRHSKCLTEFRQIQRVAKSVEPMRWLRRKVVKRTASKISKILYSCTSLANLYLWSSMRLCVASFMTSFYRKLWQTKRVNCCWYRRQRTDKGAKKFLIKLSNSRPYFYAIIHFEYIICKIVLCREVSQLMEMSTKRRKVALKWQTTEFDRSSDWRLICDVEAHRKKDNGWNYKPCKWYTDSTIIITYGTTSFAFLWFHQTENLEANCNEQGE